MEVETKGHTSLVLICTLANEKLLRAHAYYDCLCVCASSCIWLCFSQYVYFPIGKPKNGIKERLEIFWPIIHNLPQSVILCSAFFSRSKYTTEAEVLPFSMFILLFMYQLRILGISTPIYLSVGNFYEIITRFCSIFHSILACVEIS